MNPLMSVRGAITTGFVAALVLSLLISPTSFGELSLARWLHVGSGVLWVGLVGDGVNYYQLIIGLGAWLGTLKLFNVWVLIWPSQKKVLGLIAASDEEKARARRAPLLALRTDLVLSIPMLLCMGSATHGLPR